jgi:amino acid permease
MARLDSLRYTSGFALTAVFYLIFVVLVFYISPPDEMGLLSIKPPTLDEIVWITFPPTSKMLASLPLFVFAFTCHQNIFSIYNELGDNSQKEMEKVISQSVGSSLLVYQIIGVFGYLTFGSHVSSNIIGMYPDSGFVTGGQLAIAMLVLLSYPLQLHPCRASMNKVLSGDTVMDTKRFVTITICTMILSYIVAISVSNLSTVLSVVGATGSTTICYILPGLFYYKMKVAEGEPNGREWLTWFGMGCLLLT